MSFEEFVSTREAMAWTTGTPYGPSRPNQAASYGSWPAEHAQSFLPEPGAKRRGFSFYTLFLAAGVVAVLTLAAAAGSGSTGAQLGAGAEQFRDAAQFEWYLSSENDPALRDCLDPNGCWVWRIVSSTDCLAIVTLGFSTTGTPGHELTFERGVILDSSQDVPVLVEAGRYSQFEYGDILRVRCQ